MCVLFFQFRLIAQIQSGRVVTRVHIGILLPLHGSEVSRALSLPCRMSYKEDVCFESLQACVCVNANARVRKRVGGGRVGLGACARACAWAWRARACLCACRRWWGYSCGCVGAWLRPGTHKQVSQTFAKATNLLKVPRTAPSLKTLRTQNLKADCKAHTFFTGLLGKVALS